MPLVTYDGPTSRDDLSTEFIVPAGTNKAHRLVLGQPTEVPDDVAKVLLGDDSPKGHKFSKGKLGDGEQAPKSTSNTNPAPEASGASGGAGGGGTTRATART